MKYINTSYSLSIVLLLFLVSSCKKVEFENTIKDSELPKNVLPKMKPLVEEPSLDGNFISNTRKKIAHFYNKNWPKKRANGAFLVAKNGQIVFEKYDGLANFNKKDTITASTPLHIASVSKVITAAAVLKLANAKRLSLDQKVKSILMIFVRRYKLCMRFTTTVIPYIRMRMTKRLLHQQKNPFVEQWQFS